MLPCAGVFAGFAPWIMLARGVCLLLPLHAGEGWEGVGGPATRWGDLTSTLPCEAAEGAKRYGETGFPSTRTGAWISQMPSLPTGVG